MAYCHTDIAPLPERLRHKCKPQEFIAFQRLRLLLHNLPRRLVHHCLRILDRIGASLHMLQPPGMCLPAVAARAERLHVLVVELVASVGDLIDVVNLEALVEKTVTDPAAKLLSRRDEPA